ncbi:MAG: Na+-dependent transporter [Proteobacteria bacterium]|nr:Na+-dependent transporter [Pseudomonadota bacterium]
MTVLGAPQAALAWLGRQGTRAIAALVFIGLALPPVDALLKPFVTEAIFALLVIAFVRVDPAALRGYLGRPRLVLAATAWTMLVLPALYGAGGLLLGLDAFAPDLFLALVLQAVASPMMAAPAFAALMGLDATLVLVTLVASSILTPITAPLFAYAFVGPGLSLSPLTLGLKLLAILAGSVVVAAVIRRLVGAAALARYGQEIDGFNILVVFVFVAAVMENVVASVIAAPFLMLGLAALAFALSFAVLGLTALAFARTGRDRAFVLGLMASQRNMGLMLAATGGALPDLAWIWFALCQFPIYLTPQLLKPLARRVLARASA